MVLTNTFIRTLAITFVVAISACSSQPPIKTAIPTEDRTETRNDYEQSPILESNETIILPQEQPQKTTKEMTVTVPVSPTKLEKKKQSPAVVALLASAQKANKNGDIRSAQSSLQRAQRIAPQDPDVYYALANIHRNLQDYALAEQVALKGISIVQGQAKQLKRFWLLIVSIRKESDNISGAKKAQSTADLY